MIKCCLSFQVLLVCGLLVSCSSLTSTPIISTPSETPPILYTNTAVPSTTPTPAPTPTPQGLEGLSIWEAQDLPSQLTRSLNLPASLKNVKDADQATYKLDVLPEGQSSDLQSQWVYALVAPFPSLTDGISAADLKSFWKTGESNPFKQQPILMTNITASVLQKAWGKPPDGVIKIVDANNLLDTAWKNQPAWAIVPFEDLEPRWKVLRVDDQSPVDKAFDSEKYPLTIRIGITGDAKLIERLKSNPNQPLVMASNRNADHLTVVMMTGTTAMVRYMALRMEQNGVLYPATEIGKILSDADITHISNEVPFYGKCPPADPVRREMRFCSAPKYLDLLKAIGMDVVELTGNHELDWGPVPMLDTIELYNTNGIKYYGGGVSQEDGQKPLLLENNGNKIAFMGCSPSVVSNVFATKDSPGPAKCDWHYIQDQMKKILADGYLPIFTFQHIEADLVKPVSAQRIDFQKVSDWGAVIVSGSQAHFPQTMTFKNGKFIHYGLGNTFFDQMEDWHRPGFLDRQIIYEGRHISTDLVTIILDDYAKPRLMTVDERQKFLKSIFDASVWDNK